MRDALYTHFATLWLVGKSPLAPGTCGSLAAVLAAPFLFIPLSPLWRVAALAALFGAGWIASSRAEAALGKKDPAEVIIDEVFGQWLTLLPFAAPAFWVYAAAFALFRLFDITKPWPIKRAEALPGGLGIMLDDGVAGLYAMICLAVLVGIVA